MLFTARGEKPTEPYAWESTTPAFTRYITDLRYQKLPSFLKSWYKPYRCNLCEKSAHHLNGQMLTALELLLARYVEVAPDPESDGEVQLSRAVIAAARGAGHE